MSGAGLGQHEQGVAPSAAGSRVHLGMTLDAGQFARQSAVVLLTLTALLLMICADFIAAPDRAAYSKWLTLGLGAIGMALVFFSSLIPRTHRWTRRGFATLGIAYTVVLGGMALVITIGAFASVEGTA